jgi:hypothetical protein
MIMKIGENAGKVFESLRGKKQVSIENIVKLTALNKSEVDRALGWLAREGKVRIEKDKKSELVTLTE